MSLVRTPVKPLLAALVALAIVAFTACGREEGGCPVANAARERYAS